MPIENYIIGVFCWIEDYLAIILNGKRLRARGAAAGTMCQRSDYNESSK